MFVVIELQKAGENVYNLVTQHSTMPEAENKYHTVLAAAAVSNIDAHSALLVSDTGTLIKSECYLHTNEE